MAVQGINSVLTEAHITAILDKIGMKESTSTPGGPINTNIGRSKDPGVIKAGHQNYGVINSIGFVGKYQVGYLGLADAGYVKIGPKKNSDLLNPANWLGVNGCSDLDSFLKNPSAQEDAVRKLIQANYRYMRKHISDCNTADVGGYIGAAHLVGWCDAIKLRNGVAKADGNGTSSKTYFDMCRAACTGDSFEIPSAPKGKDTAGVPPEEPKKVEEKTSADFLGATTVAKSEASSPTAAPREVETVRTDNVKVPPEVAKQYATTGFIDPNLTYPRSSYKKFPDTNKLAIHKDVRNTVVDKKNNDRHRNIPTASGNNWEEPESPYNAKYPYNKVTETESGHIIEIDDTPGAERIHQYHMKGTYTEINESGSMVRRIVGDSYEIIDRNGNIFINGRCNLTVGGPAHVLILADANLVVKGDTNITSENDVNWEVSGNFNLSVNGTMNTRVFGDVNEEYEQSHNNYVGASSYTQVVGNVTEKYDALQTTKVASNKTTQVGGNRSAIVTGNDATEITGTRKTKVTGAVSNNYAATLKTKTGGDVITETGAKFDVKAGGATNIKSGGNINMDGSQLHLNSGSASPGSGEDIDGVVIEDMYKAIFGEPADKKRKAEQFPFITHANNRQPVSRAAYTDDSQPNMSYRSRTDSVSTTIGELSLDSGEYTPTNKVVEQKETAKNYTTQGTSTVAAAGVVTTSDGSALTTSDGTPVTSKDYDIEIDPNQFLSMTQFPLTLQISKFFTLKDLVYNEGQNRLDKVEGNGITKGEVVFNLSMLAQKILDRIKYAYPKMAINSGLRLGAATKSQHNRGQAADVRFVGMPLHEYEGVAKWIKDNLPYDQVILESAKNNPTSLWVHVSFDSKKQRKMPMTMANGGVPGSPSEKWDGIDITKLSWINTSYVKAG